MCQEKTTFKKHKNKQVNKKVKNLCVTTNARKLLFSIIIVPFIYLLKFFLSFFAVSFIPLKYFLGFLGGLRGQKRRIGLKGAELEKGRARAPWTVF